MVDDLATWTNWLARATNGLIEFNNAIPQFFGGLLGKNYLKDTSQMGVDVGARSDLEVGGGEGARGANIFIKEMGALNAETEKSKIPKVNVTNHNHFEIKVANNADPNRVAMATLEVIKNEMRRTSHLSGNPRLSP